jgi:ring-1,2-phenylacetyl-CoA epoxidase subunit PaaE
MGLFSFIKKEKATENKGPKGFFEVDVKDVKHLTVDTVQVEFVIPDSLASSFQFIPGQYLNIAVTINGKEERRSYSICSGKNEPLAIAVKAINKGLVSNWVKNELKANDKIWISSPQGNFKLKSDQKNIVCIAAGSGITPILSISKENSKNNGQTTLCYGNRFENGIIFHDELNSLSGLTATYYLSGEEKSGYQHGRINNESFTAEIKKNLDLLKADAFFICGPEEMIKEVKQTLTFFGVPESKINYELFTVKETENNSDEVSIDFTGLSKIKVILDDEVEEFELDLKGKSILTAVEEKGMDAPYSCRGGVCCSCKAKVIQGKAIMKMNYSLTDQEIEDGYVLTCQAHPASEKVVITFDE